MVGIVFQGSKPSNSHLRIVLNLVPKVGAWNNNIYTLTKRHRVQSTLASPLINHEEMIPRSFVDFLTMFLPKDIGKCCPETNK
mmetsp:Transcript_1827/g.3559  ORF Transcript_1827/g.3559 Transcript_1827/m.3559 type:complete len:83 (+) Transcript_1827:536-784(+)